MRLPTTTKVLLGFAAALGVVCLIGVASYQSTGELSRDTEWVTHTHQVLHQIAEALSRLKDAETSQRGYLLTGDERHLNLYIGAGPDVEERIRELRRLTADNPSQQGRVEALGALARERLALLEERVRMARAGRRAEALDRLGIDRGREVMDEARSLVAAMEREEEDLLAVRAARAGETAWRARAVVLAGTGAAFLVAGAFGLTVLRDLRRPAPPLRLSHRRFTWLYVAALGALALIAVAGQALVQISLASQARDATVLSLAGRQRMLSQRLCKATLALRDSADPAGRDPRLEEIRALLPNWRKVHQGLQNGDSDLGLPGDNGPEVADLFTRVRPHFEEMYSSAGDLLAAAGPGPRSGEEARMAGRILRAEGTYLKAMDEVVGRYEEESRARVGRLRVLEAGLLAATLCVLLLVGLYVFRPAVRALNRSAQELASRNAELDVALGQAEAASRAMSEFLAAMSHELRTPLNSVIGFSNILLKNKAGNLREQDQTYLRRILDNGKHLLGLLNGILDLSKVEAGRMETELAPVDLSLFVRETLDQLAPQARERGLELVAEVPPTAPLETDAAKLKQVLINLVGNGLKFTERGGVTVRVDVDHETGRPLRLDVTDTGIGISEDKLEVIFEAFRQADQSTSRKYGGTGLGLSLSRSFCRLLGYELELFSTLGQGSTFRIRIDPSAPSPPPAPIILRPSALGTTPRAAPSCQEPESGRRVLVIDDECDARVVLVRQLEDFGCKVTCAGSGTEGLSLARCVRPELILLDLMMTQMNGWEVLRQLRADPEIGTTPVAIVSIVGRENRATLAAADLLINKPASREELIEALHLAAPRAAGLPAWAPYTRV